jgi:hypothetical protein
VSRYEVEVAGDNLGRARQALDNAGITSVAVGAFGSSGTGESRVKSRLARTAVIPILIVIVLAFLGQRLFGTDNESDAVSYDQFLEMVEQRPQTIERVTLLTDPSELEVTLSDGDQYTLDYPPSSEGSLVDRLRRQRIETEVDSSETTGVLGLISYLLPFVLFFGFWLFLMARMRRRFPSDASEVASLKAVVEAESEASAEVLVRRGLPADSDYRVGRPKRWT